MSPRPWYRWHPLTWLAVSVMAFALATANNLASGSRLETYDGLRWDQGWPTMAREEITHFTERGDFGNPVRWNFFSLAINVAAAASILASTAYVCEAWLRSGLRRMQFNLGFLLAAITIAPILIWAHNHFDTGLYRWLRNEMPWLPKYAYYNWLGEFPWPLSAVLIGGECCLLYASGALLGRGWIWLRKRLFGQ